MKTSFKFIVILSTLSFLNVQAKAQHESKLMGAWQSKAADQTTLVLFQDGYFTHTVFTDKSFLYSYGGPFTANNGKLVVEVEFNSRDENGSTHPLRAVNADFTLDMNQLTLRFENQEEVLEQIDNSEGPLVGLWQITDRMQEGKLVPIQRSGTRKTLKMLTGTRFQWFAIDPATRLFAGTGGGTYSFENGKYTEHIDLFSRDNTRIGAQLAFDGKLENGKWHHSGLSSKGDKIYEVWGRLK